MINVVIADDSAFLRQVLKEVLESSKKIRVVEAVKNGKEAVEAVKAKRPDLLILDCEMPVMNGLEALRRIMEECPLPVFMFSSLTREGASVTIKALEYGAVDFLLKPTSLAQGLAEVSNVLIRKVEIVALRGKFSGLAEGKARIGRTAQPSTTMPFNKIQTRHIDLIAMGSSTGGVQATMKFVPKIPAESPPIVWVQHMPEHFTKSFADRLSSLSKMKVKEAENGDFIERGHVYLARGGVQMKVMKNGTRLCLQVQGTEKVSGFCPSCDVLFNSVADIFSNNTLGIILTGMGKDGANGLKRMHDKGAFVIGQDEATSVVYGMPKAAFEAGAVDCQLAIDQFEPAVNKICGLS